MVPVGLMVSYHPLEHGFDDFFDNFNLSISLRVVGRGVLVLKIQHGLNLGPNRILKMMTVV